MSATLDSPVEAGASQERRYVRLVPPPVLPEFPQLRDLPPFPKGVMDGDIGALIEGPSLFAYLEQVDQIVAYNNRVQGIRDRVTRSAESIFEFARIYFPNVFRSEFSQLHYEMMDLIFHIPEEDWFVQDLSQEIDPVLGHRPYITDNDGNAQTRQGIIAAAPRGHAKSSFFTFLVPIYCAAFRIKKFILVLSDSDDQVRLFTSDIRRQIEENQLLKHDFGDLCGGHFGLRWTGADFSIAHVSIDEYGRDVVQHECRIMGRSINSRLRGIRSGGHRPDMILMDDIENDENVESVDQRDKLEFRINRAVIPMLDPQSGILFMCGTILHFDSVLNRMLAPDRANSYVQRVWRCIVEGRSVLDNNAVPIWPARFSLLYLRQVYMSMSAFEFNTEWMNNPEAPGGRDYKTEYFNWFRRQDCLRINRDTYEWEWRRPGSTEWERLILFQAVDPAISEKQTADYFVMVTLGLGEKSMDVVFLNMVRDRWNFNDQVEVVMGQFMTFPQTTRCGVEAVQYQEALRQTVLHRQQQEEGIKRIPIRPLNIGKNVDSKRRRLRARSWDFQSKCFWFPVLAVGDEGYNEGIWTEEVNGVRYRLHKRFAPAYTEMIEFPKSAHDDCLDTIDMCFQVMGMKRMAGKRKIEKEMQAKKTRAKQQDPIKLATPQEQASVEVMIAETSKRVARDTRIKTVEPSGVVVTRERAPARSSGVRGGLGGIRRG